MPALLTKKLCTGIIAPTTGQLLTEPLRWLLQRPNLFLFLGGDRTWKRSTSPQERSGQLTT